MKKIEKAYKCYMEDGSNRIYLNKHAGRTSTDEISIVLTDGMKIVKNFYDCRCIEYNGVIYTDNELRMKGDRAYINLYILFMSLVMDASQADGVAIPPRHGLKK